MNKVLSLVKYSFSFSITATVASLAVISSSISTPSFAFTITGRSVPGFSEGLTIADKFAAEGLTLVSQSRIDSNIGFLEVNGNDVLSYTANQALSSSGNIISDFDFANPFEAASSTATNLTSETLNVWIGDLDGDPNTDQANTYDFISSTGQSLLGQRFFNGTFNSAIEVILSPGEALTVVTVGSDANPLQLGDDGRYITIAESNIEPPVPPAESIPEPTTTIGLILTLTSVLLNKKWIC